MSSSLNMLCNDALSSILTFCDATDLSRLSRVSKRLYALSNDEELWKNLCMKRPLHLYLNLSQREWKKHYYLTRTLEYRCLMAREKAKRMAPFLNIHVGAEWGRHGVWGIFYTRSQASCSEMKAGRVALNQLCKIEVNEKKLRSLDRVDKVFLEAYEVLKQQFSQRRAEQWQEEMQQLSEDYDTARNQTTILAEQAIKECWLDSRQQAKMLFGADKWAICTRDLVLAEHLLASFLSLGMIGVNIFADARDFESPSLNQMNCLGGAFVMALGVSTIMMGSSVVGPLFASSGVCFILKGTIPRRKWVHFLGDVAGSAFTLYLKISDAVKDRFRF